MPEELAWKMFMMTGEIGEYLLYKNAEPPQDAAAVAAEDLQ